MTVVDAGDTLDPVSVEADLVIAVGGDNSATMPVALGRLGDRMRSAGLVTLDAHHDLRDGVSNGSPVRQLVEAGMVGERIVQIGIEPLRELVHVCRRVPLRSASRSSPARSCAIARSMMRMSEALDRAASAGGPVHVDLDVDVCDRSVAPACPASVPGGISAIELRAAARAAGRHPSVVSIDLGRGGCDGPTLSDRRTVRSSSPSASSRRSPPRGAHRGVRAPSSPASGCSSPTTMSAPERTDAALVVEDGRVAWVGGAAGHRMRTSALTRTARA